MDQESVVGSLMVGQLCGHKEARRCEWKGEREVVSREGSVRVVREDLCVECGSRTSTQLKIALIDNEAAFG